MTQDSKASARTTVRAQICFSDELPANIPPFGLPPGVNMIEVELDDITYIIIRPGGMERPLYDEWNRYLDRVTTQGNWHREPSRGVPRKP
jgi:hypothetical protein